MYIIKTFEIFGPIYRYIDGKVHLNVGVWHHVRFELNFMYSKNAK